MNLTKVQGMNPQGTSWSPTLDELLSPQLQVVNRKEDASGTVYAKLISDYRNNENVIEKWCYVLDIDKSPYDVRTMLTEGLQGFQGCFHTTYSHNPKHEKYCYRVILPTDKSVSPDDFETGFLNLVDDNKVLSRLRNEGILDMTAKDKGRFYYDFSCPPDREEFAYTHRLDGCTPYIPDTQKRTATNNDARRTARLLTCATPETPRAVSQVEHALSQITADCSYVIWRNVIWGLLSTGWSCSVELAMTWSKTAPELYNEAVFNNVVDGYDPSHDDSPSLGTVYYLASKGGPI